ncbi:hypothetical protein Halha_0341 [Halobacteroides halobius DSM 5150]|uniref:Uncharacterized protein n=1 Tax=Halobacteroides halobius (strain ATCC 35273 / DSM 5150 / MD-1) TaxID=748449 RepID=L0K8B6_HALHC|nr:hypothetical protein [Halobacteroides halobius]AGB40348.1 hypothetical protein Halha_0341 [Halobacteroides halobius DSM 5150]
MKQYVVVFLCVVFIIVGIINFFINVSSEDPMSIIEFLYFGLVVLSLQYLGMKILSIFMYKTDKEVYLEREKIIKKSGQLIMSRRCSGNISRMNYHGPGFKVMIYPRGLIIKVMGFKQPIPIFLEEITNINIKQERIADKLEIEHNSKIVDSPIVLATGFYIRFFTSLDDFKRIKKELS